MKQIAFCLCPFVVVILLLIVLSMNGLGMSMGTAFVSVVSLPIVPEAWDGYKREKGYQNIAKEKVIRRLRRTKIYSEVLLEVHQNQPARVTEIAHALNYNRDWVAKVLKWLEQAKLVKTVTADRTLQNGGDDLAKRTRDKVQSLVMAKRLSGATYYAITKASFYSLTLRGMEFIPVAAESLGLASLNSTGNGGDRND